MSDVRLDILAQRDTLYSERSVVSPGERGDTNSRLTTGAFPVFSNDSYFAERSAIVTSMCQGCTGGYCFPKIILEHNLKKVLSLEVTCTGTDGCPVRQKLFDSKIDNRMLVQMQCINAFKYVESQKQERDIGLKESQRLWNDGGYDRVFAAVYQPSLTPEELFKRVIAEAYTTEWG